MLLRKNKKIKKILFLGIFLFLILIWWMSSLIWNPYTGFSTLKYRFELSKTEPEFLYKGKAVRGEIISPENNLGIISVHFNRYIKPDFELEDEIVFRIKEKGQKKWLYEQRYHSGLVEGVEIFPFGFPLIEESKNKTYVFEISSLKGNKKNVLSLSKEREYFSEHVFSLPAIKNDLPSYLIKKSINSVFNINYLINSLLFALPLILFFLLLSFFNKSRLAEKYLPSLVLMLIALDIFIIPIYTPGAVLVLICLWLISLRQGRIGSSINFLLAGILFSIWLFSAYFMNNLFITKLNIWTYSFLTIGILELFFEYRLKI